MAEALSAAQKAAIVATALGAEASGQVFKCLSEREIERLVREIATLGQVSRDVSEKVLAEFHDLSMASAQFTLGGLDNARRLLESSLGADEARRVVDRVVASASGHGGFANLDKANPQQLSKLVVGEHPQTVALIVAHLNPTSAAELLSQLPDEMKAEVLLRMASLGNVPPDVVQRISTVIDQRLKALGEASRERHGGVRAVAELFNQLDRGQCQAALERIEMQNPEMATAIRNLMFVFDDLKSLEDTALREVVGRAEKNVLAVALKGASEELREKFYQNMSKRAGEQMKEEMEQMGPVRLRDVEKAQHEIVAVAKALEEEGVISTVAQADEAYVV